MIAFCSHLRTQKCCHWVLCTGCKQKSHSLEEFRELSPGVTVPSVSDLDLNIAALRNSLWTMMLKELFKFVGTAPYTFLGGLLLLSELLPLPLPLQTREVRRLPGEKNSGSSIFLKKEQLTTLTIDSCRL